MTSAGAGPVIGLTTYREQARWGAWDDPAVLLPASYSDEIRRAGGIPVLLPSVPGIEAVVGRLDGLVLTGGGDLDPATYGAGLDPHTRQVRAERDESELALLTAALTAGLPVFGICRGFQVLNVACGGTLCQHLPNDAGHTPAPGTFGSHPVRVAPGSLAAAILGGGGEYVVPTAHHQGLGKLGEGLVATAWAADGLVEAVELAPGTRDGQHEFVLAVQWHPEADGDQRLLQALVAAASGPRLSGVPAR